MSPAVELFERPHLPVLEQPRRRGDCRNVPRPCPFSRCRFSLLSEAKRPPSAPSCSLDLADAGATTVEAVADVLGVSPERVRQVQQRALRRFAEAAADVLR